MPNLRTRLNSFLRDDRGITIVEYAIGAGLISSALVLGLTSLGLSVVQIFRTLTAFLAG